MSLPVDPYLVPATGEHRGVLVWRWGTPMPVLSSAPVGGGPGVAEWVLNIGVGSDYDRTDLSDHAGEVAAGLGLRGIGVAMFTAVDLSRRQRWDSGGVVVDATVGIRPSHLGRRNPSDGDAGSGRHDQPGGAVAGRAGPGGGSECGDHGHGSQVPGVGNPRGAGNRDRHRRDHDSVAGRGPCGAGSPVRGHGGVAESHEPSTGRYGPEPSHGPDCEARACSDVLADQQSGA